MKFIIRKIADIILKVLKQGSRTIIYVGSLDLFIDNAKHQFIYQNETMPDHEHVWITKKPELVSFLRQKGFKAYLSTSFVGIWKQLRAKVLIEDNPLQIHLIPRGTVVIELWHGIPNKKIMHARWETPTSDAPYTPKTLEGKRRLSKYFVLNTSSKLDNVITFAFCVPVNNLIYQNYPRNRVLLMGEDNLKGFISKYESNQIKTLYSEIKKYKGEKIVYMPTFRDGNPDFMKDALPDLNALNEVCVKNNISFFMKPHRVASPIDVNQFSNIHIFDGSIDLYPLLPLFDILITDYSGIMFDFSIMKKNIIIYNFDEQHYNDSSRELYSHYYRLKDQLTCVRKYNELLELLGNKKRQIKPFPYQQFIEDIYEFNAVAEHIKKICNI